VLGQISFCKREGTKRRSASSSANAVLSRGLSSHTVGEEAAPFPRCLVMSIAVGMKGELEKEAWKTCHLPSCELVRSDRRLWRSSAATSTLDIRRADLFRVKERIRKKRGDVR